MQLHDLRPADGSTKKRKRVGRGTGSGKGKTSSRGTKGQRARTGVGIHAAFEGGQMRMTKRLPKMRGFNNRFKVEYTAINLDSIERHFEANAEVSPETMAAAGLLDVDAPVVVLARGDVSKALSIKAHRISEAARKKVEAAGGSIEILPFAVNKNLPRS